MASATLSLFSLIFINDPSTPVNLEEAFAVEEEMSKQYMIADSLGTYRVKPYRTKKAIRLKDVDQWPSEVDQLDEKERQIKTAPISVIIPPRIICYVRIDRDYDQVDLEVLMGQETSNKIYSMTVKQWEAVRGSFTKLKDKKVYGSPAEGVANLAVKKYT